MLVKHTLALGFDAVKLREVTGFVRNDSSLIIIQQEATSFGKLKKLRNKFFFRPNGFIALWGASLRTG